MRLIFLGTRGYIEARTPRHRMHTALLVVHRSARVLIDCGEDWAGRVGRLRLGAILVTHAHPDHAAGLRAGAPCPVWATRATWRAMAGFAIAPGARRIIVVRRPGTIAGIAVEAFPVVHSLRAPAVGYRLRAGRTALFYVPDVLAIPARAAALRGVHLYVGDGASIVRPIVRRRGAQRFGHAAIRTQLDWCRAEGVARAVFTHCGSQIVGGDERRNGARIAALGATRAVAARLAHDGMVIDLRRPFRHVLAPETAGARGVGGLRRITPPRPATGTGRHSDAPGARSRRRPCAPPARGCPR
jgi:phosphoribosyl 1,2-cyclic phosphodiesterase